MINEFQSARFSQPWRAANQRSPATVSPAEEAKTDLSGKAYRKTESQASVASFKASIAKERIANGHSYCEIGEPAGEKLPVKLSVLRRRCSAKCGFRCLHVISPFRVKGYSNEYARTDRAQ
jgi:hypothetical protein